MSLQVRFLRQFDNTMIDLDLQLASQGITAVFGPSGAGKSSLLRVIAGLDKVQGAQVRFNESIWQSDNVFIPCHQRNVAMVFQQPSLFEHMTVEQNIYYAKRVASKTRQSSLPLNDVIDSLGLRSLLKRAPQSLSGGEQQRVAIVRALAANPDLLLMDEPLASLDDKLKSDFMQLFDDVLSKAPIPVVYVTHSKQEVARLSNELILLDQGRCVGQGTTSQVLTDFAHDLAVAEDAKCALQGKVIEHDEQHHVSKLSTQAGDLWVGYLPRGLGSQVNVVIKAKDVSITLSKQPDTSILNILQGQLVDFREVERGKVMLKVAIHNSFLLSQITLKSFSQLRLTVGQNVFVQVKSVAVS